MAFVIEIVSVAPCSYCIRRTESTPSLYFVHWHHWHRNLAEMVVDHSGKQGRTSLAPYTLGQAGLVRQEMLH